MSDRHRPKRSPLHYDRHTCKGKNNFKDTLHQSESRPRCWRQSHAFTPLQRNISLSVWQKWQTEGGCTREGWEQLWIVQRWQCVSNRTDQDIRQKRTDSAVHDHKDLCDCQRERSHPLRQCSMPMARIDRRASREQGTSCGKVRGSCYQRRNWMRRGSKHTPFRKLVTVLKWPSLHQNHWLAIAAPKKKRIQTKKAKPVANASEPLDITLESTPSKSQSSAPERTEPDGSQEHNTVLSESVPQAELGPKMKGIGKKRVKDGPIRKADSTEIPRRKYYRPAADTKTYRMNGQGQLQCQQDPKDMTRVGSVKELPLCREKPIFHEPVGALIKDKEQLTAMYPNSFSQNWQSEGRIHHQDRPKHRPCTAGKAQGTNWEQRSHLCGPGQHDCRWYPWATDRTDSMG